MIQLPEYYTPSFVMCRPSNSRGMLHIDLWRFKSLKSGKIYLVDVEVYEKHIYGIKFYLKSQAHKSGRYSFQTGDFEPRRIVLSCFQIMLDYYNKDSRSSFAFIGANSAGEKTSSTKRFRFYRRMVNTHLGIATFEHMTDERNSAYLLLRRTELSSGRIIVSDVEDFFRNIYVMN